MPITKDSDAPFRIDADIQPIALSFNSGAWNMQLSSGSNYVISITPSIEPPSAKHTRSLFSSTDLDSILESESMQKKKLETAMNESNEKVKLIPDYNFEGIEFEG